MSQDEPLRALIVERLLPVMTTVLDEATSEASDGPGVEIFRIDRLDVDLGDVAIEALPDALAERLAQALSEALRYRVGRMGRVPLGGEDVALSDTLPEASGAREAATTKKVRQFATETEADIADLMAFLTDGRTMPVSHGRVSGQGGEGREGRESMPGATEDTDAKARRGDAPSDLTPADPLDRLLSQVLKGDIQNVRRRIRASASPEVLIGRLTKQFSASGIEALIRALHPTAATEWLRGLDALDKLLANAGWRATARAQAQMAARAKLIAAGMLSAEGGPDARVLPWHDVWQVVLSSAHMSVDVANGDAMLDRAREIVALADTARRSGEIPRAMVDALHRVAESFHGVDDDNGPSTDWRIDVLSRLGQRSATTAANGTDTSDGVRQTHDASTDRRIDDFGGAATANEALPRDRLSLAAERGADARVVSRAATPPRLRKALAVALMRGQAQPLYDRWPQMMAKESGLLRDAMHHYVSVTDLRERIAATFPVSMLEDMLALVLPHASVVSDEGPALMDSPGVGHEALISPAPPNLTSGADVNVDARASRAADRTDADADMNEGESDKAQTHADIEGAVVADNASVAAWKWRRAWAHDMASSLMASGQGANLQRDAGDHSPRSTGAERPLPTDPETTATPVPELASDASDGTSRPTVADARHDGLLRALLSGSPAMLLDHWSGWLTDDSASLASIWRHYAKYETVLTRVVGGFPEDMLAELATALAPSASSLWHAFSALSIDMLAPPAAISSATPTAHTAHTAHAAHAAFVDWKRTVWRAFFTHLLSSGTGASTAVATVAVLRTVAQRSSSVPWQQQVVALWMAGGAARDASKPHEFGPPIAPASLGHVMPAAPSSVQPKRDGDESAEALQRLIRHRREIVPSSGDLIDAASQLSESQREAFRREIARSASSLTGEQHGLTADDWHSIVETMIAVSEAIPAVHGDVLYRAIVAQAPEVAPMHSEAVARYFASVAAALAQDTVLELDALCEAALEDVPMPSNIAGATSTWEAASVTKAGDLPPLALNDVTGAAAIDPPEFTPETATRRATMPDDFIAYLTSHAFRDGQPPPSGLDIWLRQSVYSGAHVLRPVIARAAEDETLTERWLDLIPQPLWPGIARLSSRDTPQVAHMLRVATDVTELFATTVEAVTAASLYRARWSFLFAWLFVPQRAFDAAVFATSLVERLARHANVEVPPALAARVHQQTGIDMSTNASNGNDAQQPVVDVAVRHAGVVLIWPFLSRLWDVLHLTHENRFVSDAAAERAVLLLHYAGTGLTDVPEHDLTIHKLLCGVPSATPVARHLDITEEEASLCDQVIDAMLQHWRSLGNTSRAGLRETFLQRDGRLSLAEDGWHLTVQRSAFDVLLTSLPWSISTIRLSWMEQTLWVKWA